MTQIPVLLPLPSDRPFIPSPDPANTRHMTAPTNQSQLVTSQTDDVISVDSVSSQCCEIMGGSSCKACRKLESRLLNREKAHVECPRMRATQTNIAMTQIVKRLFPHLKDYEIQEKIARGEINRSSFQQMNSVDQDLVEKDDVATPKTWTSGPTRNLPLTENISQLSETEASTHASFYTLAKLVLRLHGETSTPLFFSNLKQMQGKIMAGQVERKAYLKTKHELSRLKSAMSSISGTSSAKSTLSKIGSRLTQSMLPVFVSPRKAKETEEPSYKVYFEPPLLSKRRQIPNPSFFAGSTEEYRLPDRLPDVIEMTDSKRLDLTEKRQLSRSGSSTSTTSTAVQAETDALDKFGNRGGHFLLEDTEGVLSSKSLKVNKLRSASAPLRSSQPIELENLNKRSESTAAVTTMLL